MCFHVSIPDNTQIEEFLGHGVHVNDWTTFYHHLAAFSFSKIPVMTQEDHSRVQTFQWGLIPHTCKNEKEAKEMMNLNLNVKTENIFEKTVFRSSIEHKRCLIFVDGFFEWRDVNKKKYPYFITLKNQKVFALGGIYESWLDEKNDKIIHTCSVVTTPANELMSKIHNIKLRMPLIFTKKKMMEWIYPGLAKDQIRDMMKPLEDGLLEAKTVSQLISSRKEETNVPQVKAKFDYPELDKI